MGSSVQRFNQGDYIVPDEIPEAAARGAIDAGVGVEIPEKGARDIQAQAPPDNKSSDKPAGKKSSKRANVKQPDDEHPDAAVA